MPSSHSETRLGTSNDGMNGQQSEDVVIPTINFNPLLKILSIALISMGVGLYLSIPAFANMVNLILNIVKSYYKIVINLMAFCLTTASNMISHYALLLSTTILHLVLALGHYVAFLFNFNSISNLTAAVIGGSISGVLFTLVMVSLTFFVSGIISVLKNHFSTPKFEKSPAVELDIENEPLNQSDSNKPAASRDEPISSDALQFMHQSPQTSEYTPSSIETSLDTLVVPVGRRNYTSDNDRKSLRHDVVPPLLSITRPITPLRSSSQSSVSDSTPRSCAVLGAVEPLPFPATRRRFSRSV